MTRIRLGLTGRYVVFFLAIEVMAWLGTSAFCTTLGADQSVFAGPWALLALLRSLLYWWFTRRFIGPIDRLQRRLELGREVTEQALVEADRRLQQVPSIVVLLAGGGSSVAFPLSVLGYHILAGPPRIPVVEWWVVAFYSAVSLPSAVAIVPPLMSWMLSDAAGRHHVEAAQRGVELKRTQESIAFRLVLFSLCLTTIPIMQQASALSAAKGHELFANADREARVLAAELRFRVATSSTPEAFELANAHAERATLFVVPTSGEPVFSGAATPPWATRTELLEALAPDFTPPSRSSVIRAVLLPDGRVAGAIVSLSGVGVGFVGELASGMASVIPVVLLAAWLLSRSVSVPLARIAEATRRAAVVGDLSKMGVVPVARLDEVGTVAGNVNELVDRMRAVAEVARRVGGGQLDVILVGKGELQEAFRGMLDQLRSVVHELYETSTDVAAAAAEILAASQEQETAVTSHVAGMAEITEAMEALSGSASHVAGAVQGVLENAERTLQNTDQMVMRIDELTRHAGRIGDILDVIREIADRTDLLALNGSLEASRAGEAGVGFSLVAAEMRRLAERVTGSVGDIKSLLADIRESGASTVVATEESRKLAGGTTQVARQITLATQRQQTSTEQVTANARMVADVLRQSAGATSQTRATAEALEEQAERLMALVSRFDLSL